MIVSNEASAMFCSATNLGVVEGWLIADRLWYAFFDGTLAHQCMLRILVVKTSASIGASSHAQDSSATQVVN